MRFGIFTKKIMASNSTVKGGKLKLKGNRTIFKADKPTKKTNTKPGITDIDRAERGGWRRIGDESDVRGGIDIAIECGDFSRCYLAARDNGRFTVGAKHFQYGEPPNPEEVFTLLKSPDDTKISLKTGFGKYVGVDAEGALIAMADAVGPRERFEVIFQDGKSSVQSASSGLFLSLTPNDDGYVHVCNRTVSNHEIINVRTNTEKAGPVDWRPAEDQKRAGDCETSYVKMYQHSKVDLKNRMISYDTQNKSAVKKAQTEGDLHEVLLNRRVKLKSDKYC